MSLDTSKTIALYPSKLVAFLGIIFWLLIILTITLLRDSPQNNPLDTVIAYSLLAGSCILTISSIKMLFTSKPLLTISPIGIQTKKRTIIWSEIESLKEATVSYSGFNKIVICKLKPPTEYVPSINIRLSADPLKINHKEFLSLLKAYHKAHA